MRGYDGCATSCRTLMSVWWRIPTTQGRVDSPEADQGPGAFEEDKAELPVYDGHHRQHRRAQKVGDGIKQVGGLYPTEQVGRESAEDSQRPEDRDRLQNGRKPPTALSGERVVFLVRDLTASK